jgi:NAD(P)H dehydrogenase (quinone)
MARYFSLRRNPDQFDAATEQRFSWEQNALPGDVSSELAKILVADLVIVQFPLWWFGPPAILKGWIDRAFVYGALYSSARRHDRGMCSGKQVLMCVTTGSTEAACAPDGREGDTRLMLWPTLYAFRYVGFTVLEPFLIHGVRSSLRGADAEAQARRLAGETERYRQRLLALHDAPAIAFNSDDDWDEAGKLKSGAPVHSPFIRHAKNWG